MLQTQQSISILRAVTLRQLREQAGLTQEQLGDLAAMKQTHISQIENGKVRNPQYSTVASLARALGTTPEAVADAIAQTEAA